MFDPPHKGLPDEVESVPLLFLGDEEEDNEQEKIPILDKARGRMKGYTFCHTCKVRTGEYEVAKFMHFLTAAEVSLVSAHACSPHSASHDLRAHLELSGEDIRKEETATLKIVCTGARCRSDREMVCDVAPHYVNACVMAFHASHEGHPFSIVYGDGLLRIDSPASETPSK